MRMLHLKKFSPKVPFKKVLNLSGMDKHYSLPLRRLPRTVPVTWFARMNQPGVVLMFIKRSPADITPVPG